MLIENSGPQSDPMRRDQSGCEVTRSSTSSEGISGWRGLCLRVVRQEEGR